MDYVFTCLMAKEIIHRPEIAIDSRDLSNREEWLRKKLKLHLLGLASFERTIARLRSRILYLKKEDANTSFFHHQARFRKKKNFIAKLHTEISNLYGYLTRRKAGSSAEIL